MATPPITQPVISSDLYIGQGETRAIAWPTFVDVFGNELNLSEDTIRLDVSTFDGVNLTFLWSYVSTADPSYFTVVGGNVTVVIQAAQTSSSSTLVYQLWDDTTGLVLATGKLEIVQANHS
jgi:hypothetical protein